MALSGRNRFSLKLIWPLVFIVGCQLADNQIRGRVAGSTGGGGAPDSPGAPVVYSLGAVTALPESVSVDLTDNHLHISNIKSGYNAIFSLKADGLASPLSSCNSPEPGISVTSSGELSFAIFPKSTSGTLSFQCESNGMIFDVSIDYLAGEYSPLSLGMTTAMRSIQDETADGKWRLWLYENYSSSGFDQLVAENTWTQEVIVASSLDGTWETAGTGDSWDGRFTYDGKYLVFFSKAIDFEDSSSLESKSIYMKNLEAPTTPPRTVCTIDGTAGNPSYAGGCSGFDLNDVNHKVLLTVLGTQFSLGSGDQAVLKDLDDLSVAPVLVSTSDGSTPAALFGVDTKASFSPDGTKVVFDSRSSNLPYYNFKHQIYMKEVGNLSAAPVLLSGLDATTAGVDRSSYPIFAGNDRVIFLSYASNLGVPATTSQYLIKDITSLGSAPVILSTVDGVTPGTGYVEYSVDYDSLRNVVVFIGFHPNFPGGGSAYQAYLKDLDDLSISPVLLSSVDGSTGSDGDGMFPVKIVSDRVQFYSNATNLGASGGANSYRYYSLNLDHLSQGLTVDSEQLGSGHQFMEVTNPRFANNGNGIIVRTNLRNHGFSTNTWTYIYYSLVDRTAQPWLVCSLDGTEAHFYDCDNIFVVDQQNNVLYFGSDDLTLPGANGTQQIYRKNLNQLQDAPQLVSTNDGVNPMAGAVHSYYLDFDEDTQQMLIKSNNQVYLKDVSNLNQATALISTIDGSTPASSAIDSAVFAGSSATKVAMATNAVNFTPQNGQLQIYTKDLQSLSSAPVLVSSPDGVVLGNANSGAPQRIFGRNAIAFGSGATNLGSSPGTFSQLFIKDLDNLGASPFMLSSADNGITPGNFGPTFALQYGSVNFRGKPDLILFGGQATNFDGLSPTGHTKFMKDLSNLSASAKAINLSSDGRAIGHPNTPGCEISPNGQYYLFHGGTNASYLVIRPIE
ncbi:MAG: hypothetical protein H6626_09350 [Pseudobdellovibrionaceae bacterium]|nr:hypothetical protein [Bdellovibrionales bacterium]USN46421.1 MAG: hypothetical protein H6626_09350 [Pseudobdellovibrionaceae bacterium]